MEGIAAYHKIKFSRIKRHVVGALQREVDIVNTALSRLTLGHRNHFWRKINGRHPPRRGRKLYCDETAPGGDFKAPFSTTHRPHDSLDGGRVIPGEPQGYPELSPGDLITEPDIVLGGFHGFRFLPI